MAVAKAATIPELVARGDGMYEARWCEGRRSKRVSMGTREAGEAQTRFGQWLVERAGAVGAPIERADEILTVADVLDAYMVEHIEHHECDKERAEISIRHLKAFMGGSRIADLSIPLSRQYAEHRGNGARPVVGDTIRRELSVLVSAMNHAAAWKRLAKAAIPTLELPGKSPPRDRVLSHDELAALEDAASARTRRFIRIAYWCGRRRGVVERLHMSKVDLPARLLDFRPPRETKKRSGIKPIFDEILDDVRDGLREAADGDGFILGEKGGSIRTGLENAVRRAGLGPDVTSHTLRHSRATHMLQAGANLWDVAGLLDDTVETVERVYGHHCPEHMRRLQSFSKRKEAAEAASP